MLYDGDGSLVDHGALTKGDRFVIDLGPCDLASVGNRAYEMRRLPPRRLVVGININSDIPRFGIERKEERLTSHARLTIRNEDGEVVISEQLPLSEWVWSNRGPPQETFLWVRGEREEHSLGGGWSKDEHVGIGPDGGWGTCFQPRFRGRYALNLAISHPDPRAAALTATIRITGGGL
jgi:hypothetical protein